ncbi:MAG: ATP-binding protein, partial [Mycobacterium sp.]|nr:ATP-binding protein [Mycobacterium sp.]
MEDKVLRSGGSAPGNPDFGSIPMPWGFFARYSPRDLAGYWIEVVSLGAGRTGVLLGCCSSSSADDSLRSQALSALLETGDPIQSLSGMPGSPGSALCAVIDRTSICYSSYGQPGGVVAAPGRPPALLNGANGRRVDSPLEPGSTVLLCSAAIGRVIGLFDDCASAHPEQLADSVIVDLDQSAAVLYRHPPPPLSITLPAEPGTLSISRGKLREWLNSAGLDSETCADILLAVGEATANATEHSVLAAPGNVDIS